MSVIWVYLREEMAKLHCYSGAVLFSGEVNYSILR